MMRGYDAIKSLGKATGRTIPDLLVLARQNKDGDGKAGR